MRVARSGHFEAPPPPGATFLATLAAALPSGDNEGLNGSGHGVALGGLAEMARVAASGAVDVCGHHWHAHSDRRVPAVGA